MEAWRIHRPATVRSLPGSLSLTFLISWALWRRLIWGFKISSVVSAGESHCGRVRDRAGCVRCLVAWRPGWQMAESAAQQQVFPVRDLQFLTQAGDVGAVPGLHGGQLGGKRADHAAGLAGFALTGRRAGGAAVCCRARRCSMRARIGAWR